MVSKLTAGAEGYAEAHRIYERLEEDRKRRVQADAEAKKPKIVTLPRLKFLEGQ